MKKIFSMITLAVVSLLLLVCAAACNGGKGYRITVERTEYCSVTASKTSAKEGEEITLTVSCDEGYAADSATVNGGEVAVTDGVATFVMPAEDVSVSVIAKTAESSITVKCGKGGAISAPQKAKYGETVELECKPDFGYEVSFVKLNGTELTPKEGKYSFAMPIGNAQISAEFQSLGEQTAFPSKKSFSISSTAYLGGVAKSDWTVAFNGDDLKISAYVEDKTVVEDADGVEAYFGRNSFSNTQLNAEHNYCVSVTANGVLTLKKVNQGKFVPIANEGVTAKSVALATADGAIAGYKIEISLPLSVLGLDALTARGKLTMLPYLMNANLKGTSVSAKSATLGGEYSYEKPSTYVVLTGDNEWSDNEYLYGIGQLGGTQYVAAGKHWDVSQDYNVNDEQNYPLRRADLTGHDNADNNLVFYRSTGENLYAKVKFKVNGIVNSSERWAKFGLMLFDKSPSRGVFYYVDAFVGETGDVNIDNIRGTGLGYNVAKNGWTNWVDLPEGKNAFDLSTKEITLAITYSNGVVHMYFCSDGGDRLIGSVTYNGSDEMAVGIKCFGLGLTVSDYVVITDAKNPEFVAHNPVREKQTPAVLFVGDSYMDFWKDNGYESAARLIGEAANEGVAGTTIDYWIDSADYVSRLYEPQKIVFHIGINDINAGTSADAAFVKFERLIAAYRESFPSARIFWVSLIPNTGFPDRAEEYALLNGKIKTLSETLDYFNYINVTDALSVNGEPRVNMSYDGLHLNREYGYALWGNIVLKNLGYGRTEGTQFGDNAEGYAYGDGWSFSADGTHAINNGTGEQAIWLKGMAYAADLYFETMFQSPKNTGEDALPKVGLILRNDDFTVFGYVDLNQATEKANRTRVALVYRANTGGNVSVAGEWSWQAERVGSNTVTVEDDFVKLAIAKIGNRIYFLINDTIAVESTISGITEETKFVAGVMGFNRVMEVYGADFTADKSEAEALIDSKLNQV